MSILSDREIAELVANEKLVDPFDPHALQGASYDCSLGELMVFSGKPRRIGTEAPAFALRPGSFVLVTTKECLKLPLNVVGRSGIMSPWARRGLVCLFSPQIDPGFEGVLEVPLFNAGDADVLIVPGQRFFTVEFDRMSEAASFSWSERNGGPKRPPSQPLPPAASRPNLMDISALQRSVTSLAEDIRQSALRTESNLSNFSSSISRLDGVLTASEAHMDAELRVLSGKIDAMTQTRSQSSADAAVSLSKRQVSLALVGLIVAILLGIAAIAVPLLGSPATGEADDNPTPGQTSSAPTSPSP